jgi:hypothetical protein
MSKISLEGNVSGSGTLTIAAPNTNSNFTLTLPTETGTIITNSGNQAGSFTTLNTSGQVVFNDAGADVDFRVEGDTEPNLLFVDASADAVGVGTNTPIRPLVVKTGTSVSSVIKLCNSDSGETLTDGFDLAFDGANGYFNLRESGFLSLSTAGSERARITSGGYFKASNYGNYQSPTGSYHELRIDGSGVDWTTVISNTTSTAANAFGVLIRYSASAPNTASNEFVNCLDTSGVKATIRSNGGIANYTANDVNLSDERVKKDIANLGSQWSCIKDWNLVEFRYKEQEENTPKNYGVIAQQIQEHCPEVVTVFQGAAEAVEAKEAVLDEDGNVIEPAVEAKPAVEERIGVREQQMLWMAVKALQEAMERIETLEAKVAALEANNGV